MAAHTAGPWMAKLSASRMWHIHGQPDPAVKQSRGAVAFTAQTYGEAGMRTSAANARLIAAAPDLLEACEELDRFWTEDIPLGPGKEGDVRLFTPDTLRIWRSIRAAISRARGDQSATEGSDAARLVPGETQ